MPITLRLSGATPNFSRPHRLHALRTILLAEIELFKPGPVLASSFPGRRRMASFKFGTAKEDRAGWFESVEIAFKEKGKKKNF